MRVLYSKYFGSSEIFFIVAFKLMFGSYRFQILSDTCSSLCVISFVDQNAMPGPEHIPCYKLIETEFYRSFLFFQF